MIHIDLQMLTSVKSSSHPDLVADGAKFATVSLEFTSSAGDNLRLTMYGDSAAGIFDMLRAAVGPAEAASREPAGVEALESLLDAAPETPHLDRYSNEHDRTVAAEREWWRIEVGNRIDAMRSATDAAVAAMEARS